MKSPRSRLVLPGFLTFCLLSTFAAWSAGKASRRDLLQAGSTSAAPSAKSPPDVGIAARPPDPAWAAVSAPELVWPAADPSLLEEALANPRQAPQAVFEQVLGLPEDSAPLLRASLQKLRGKPGRESLMATLMARWTAISPLDALEFALTLPPGDASIALAAGLPDWTRHNPSAALAWCLAKYREGQIPTSVFEAIPSIGWQWGRQDLPGLLGFMQGLEAIVGGESSGALDSFAQGIGGLALQDGRRDVVLAQALDFAASQKARGARFEASFLGPLTQDKPAALAAWLDSQPDRAVSALAMGNLLSSWSLRDVAAARQWAQTTSRPVPDKWRDFSQGLERPAE